MAWYVVVDEYLLHCFVQLAHSHNVCHVPDLMPGSKTKHVFPPRTPTQSQLYGCAVYAVVQEATLRKTPHCCHCFGDS